MGALSFSSPFLLAALLALPAIWFLLRATPPSPQQVKFPAFDLLRRLARTPETPQRTPWWILLLRLAIAGLAIVGLAGPVLNAPPPPDRSGPLVIVVDNSWAAAAGWRLRQDAIMQVAEQSVRSGRETFLIATVPSDDETLRPMTGEELRDAARALQPEPLLPDHAVAIDRIDAAIDGVSDAEILFLSDGVLHEGVAAMVGALEKFGGVSIYADLTRPLLALHPPERTDASVSYRISNIGAAWRGDLVALARDGRELARTTIEAPGGDIVTGSLDLPLALQNEMAQARLDAVASAGAVQLVDARERRALVGFLASGDESSDPLLSGAHYVRKALEPYATFVTDQLGALVASDASVIVLDDVGVIRPSDAEALRAWVEKGGVIIRFAGPTLADAATDSSLLLLPVALRGGGRAFGGALTWETPQLLTSFEANGPFAGLAPPNNAYVRRQVLAEPGGETTARSWASLADGTPLVTGETIGAGAIALFHTTATPEWSDLPLSSVFIDMLRKLVFLSTLGPKNLGDGAAKRVTPFRTLDGFGVLKQPPRDIAASTLAELEAGTSLARPPGLYGAPEAPIAVNAVAANDDFRPLAIDGATIRPYIADPPVMIGPPLLLIALLLLLADGLVALSIAGRLRSPFAAAICVAILIAPMRPLHAEPLDRPIATEATAAALAMRLAYVRTGDPATDRISLAGLKGLSSEIAKRTSAEPAAPAGVDPETDDLSVYPLLYWPMTPGAAAPSELALANIENFLRFGGLIIFDTRDDERAVPGVDTPEARALKTIVGGLDLPPLAPITRDHVLYRSFYLLSDLPGRMATRPVWAQTGEGPNDSVTPVIIGGRDWAGAWATNAAGEPLLPAAGAGRPCAAVEGATPRPLRECAYRAGVNMIMVALTGNYKSDQVHTPILLERLGRQ